MSDSLRSSAKVAREFLEMMAEGIGKVESGANDLSRVVRPAAGDLVRSGRSAATDLARAGSAALSRHLPARFRSTSSTTQVIGALVIAGVVASTAALIYSRVRDRNTRGRKRR